MNYAELPLEERIRMASDYALLLAKKHLPEESIVITLQSRFLLVQEQALLALSHTRVFHKKAYDRFVRLTVYKAIAAIFVCLLGGALCLGVAEEARPLKFFISCLFLLAAFFFFGIVVRKTLTLFFYSPTLVKRNLSNKYKEGQLLLDWTVRLFLFILLVFLFTTFSYSLEFGTGEVKNVITLHGLQLEERPTAQRKGGKNSYDYYRFLFTAYNNEFRFKEEYYSYAGENFQPYLLFPGDTVSIQVHPGEYYDQLASGRREDEITLMNLITKDGPLLDLELRAKAMRHNIKRLVDATALLSIVSFCLMVFRHKRAADKDKAAGILTAHKIYS